MHRMEEHPPLTETLIGILVLVMVGAQTWIVLNEATDGDAARHVRAWWERKARPVIVRLVTWADAKAVVEAMVTDEIEPYLSMREA